MEEVNFVFTASGVDSDGDPIIKSKNPTIDEKYQGYEDTTHSSLNTIDTELGITLSHQLFFGSLKKKQKYSKVNY